MVDPVEDFIAIACDDWEHWLQIMRNPNHSDLDIARTLVAAIRGLYRIGDVDQQIRTAIAFVVAIRTYERTSNYLPPILGNK